MNILIFSWRGPKHPHIGGAEQVTHEHAKAWVKAGHSVTLFTSMFPLGMREETIDGVRVIRRGNELITVQVAAFFWFQRHKKEFDLVFDHFHGIPFYTPLFVKQEKIAFIHEVAKEVWKVNALPRYISWIPSLIGPLLERLTFTLYKKVPFITVSDSTKKDLISVGIPQNQISIIENGVSLPNRLPKYSKENVKTIMYLGALAEDKGIKDVITICSELEKATKKKYNYWIVGKGSESQMNELRRFAKKLRLTSNLKFWGFVEEDKKFELLSKAHILINPSIHEGWGLVNIEANACGTPVIGYNVHGNRDSIIENKTGTLVTKGDIKQMTKEIINLLDDSKKYYVMQKEAIAWSKKFTWEKATKQSLDYLEAIHKELI
jgi:glycosyltransferase involved in cell wall biosynthesis